MTDEISDPKPRWPIYLGVAVAGIGAFGLITWLLGLGPFAYRQILYGSSEIYLLNMTSDRVTVTLDRGSEIEIDPEGSQRTPILGGTTTITTRSSSGEVLEEVSVFVDGKPVLYNVEGSRCLVLSDVSSFYRPGARGQIEVVQTFAKGQHHFVELPSSRVIWPRQTLRDTVNDAQKGVHWIEIVGCPLLEQEEEHVLEAHLNVLLTERKKEQRRREKEAELRRKMMYEGSEGIEDASGVKLLTPDAGVPSEGASTDAAAAAGDAATGNPDVEGAEPDVE